MMQYAGGPIFTGRDESKVWLSIGGYTLSLPRLNFGDTKTLIPRNLIYRDLPLVSDYWPRDRRLELTFGSLSRKNLGYTTRQLARFRLLMQAFPGWPSLLLFPSGYEAQGVIHEIIEEEVDHCRIKIRFSFDITQEWFQEGTMVLA